MMHISLFSGIGGFDLASEWMGWTNIASCEINPFCNKILKHYWPDAYHHGDIKTLTYETIDAELSARFGNDWRNDDIIITGGFPCQPYSAAGKRLGKEDDRHLWPEMLRIIREVRPTWIVGENVLGLVNWSGGLVFEEVQVDLEAEGYEVQPFVLPAASVGAPHRRDRVWFVAYANDSEGSAEPGQVQGENGEVPKRHNNAEPGNAGDGVVADTASNRRQWERQRVEVEKGLQQESRTAWELEGGLKRFCGDGVTADTDNKGLEGRKKQGSTTGEGEGRNKQPAGLLCPNWEEFPTQSPICCRDDGLPDRLDNITFPKWRNESIKAYGNAIVPQVALQIFKAINIFSSNQNSKL